MAGLNDCQMDALDAGRAKPVPKEVVFSPPLPLLAAPSLLCWQDAEELQHLLAVLLWKRNSPWRWGN